MTSAFSSAGDRSSRFPGGDMALQNLKSLYAESPDLPIFTRAVSPCPPTAAASKTSAAQTFAPITSMQQGGTKPDPCSGLCDADVFRASQLQHSVQHVGRDGHLARLSPIR